MHREHGGGWPPGTSPPPGTVAAALALVALLLAGGVPAGENLARDVFAATAANPRYSEGSILPLSDGRLLFAITEFIEGGSDFSAAHIVARSSADGGHTWGPARVLQDNVGERNVMSATLRRLTDAQGNIAFFYLVKHSHRDLNVYVRFSRDEGETFGKPILVSDTPGYHVMNNDRVLQLRNGRLLAPVASTADARAVNHYVSFCFISDDGGQTWRKGQGEVDYAKRGAMEPEVIEMNDDRVLMIFRTQWGHIGHSVSEDGGDTWSVPSSWGVRAPEAPATLRSIPATGDWLLVWNDTFMEGEGHGGKRRPLNTAISRDEGETWEHQRILDDSPGHTFAYTSLVFHEDRALLSYYVAEDATGRISTRFRSLPVSWFHGGAAESALP